MLFRSAIYFILGTITKIMAPILAFTCDEIWLEMPHSAEDDARNVLFNEMSKPYTGYPLSDEDMAKWNRVIAVRTAVNGVLEAARAEKKIGKSLEAKVILTVPAEDAFLAEWSNSELADLFIVSQVELTVGTELSATVDNADGTKCPRCWKHSVEANADGECPRCAAVLAKLAE